MRFQNDQKFWLDAKKFRYPVVARGSYITDSAFLNELHREPLAKSIYELRVVVYLGDVEHQKDFSSPWRKFEVQ